MLFFLWGVFRGRRSTSDSVKNSVLPSSNGVSLDMNTPEKPDISLNGDIGRKGSNLDPISEQQDEKFNSKLLSKDATRNSLLSSGIRSTSPSQEEIALPDYRPDMENKSFIKATGINTGSTCMGEQMDIDASCVGKDSSSVKAFKTSNQDEGVGGIAGDEKVVDRMDNDIDETKIERDLNEDSLSMDAETSLGRDLAVKGLEGWQSNSRKRPYLDLEKKAVEISDSTSQNIPWATGNDILVDGESINKKLKGGFHAREGDSFADGFASQICDVGSSSSFEEKTCGVVSEEKVILEDVGTAERYFFPVDSRRVNDFRLGGNLMPWKGYSSTDEDRYHDGIPNLELALGAETKPQNKGIVPFFVGMVEKNNIQNKSPDKMTVKEEEDGVSASLSLSLSFPFSDKEQTAKPVSKTEQLLPERHHVNTSLLLFGGLPDK